MGAIKCNELSEPVKKRRSLEWGAPFSLGFSDLSRPSRLDECSGRGVIKTNKI